MKITDISPRSCSALTIDGGKPHRKAYINSVSGRAAFIAECADAENYAEVMPVWGPEPTVFDQTPEPVPTAQSQYDQVRADVDYLLVSEMTREGLL